MLDLRPKLAREFATAAYKVFEAAATANTPDDTIEEVTQAILDLFVSHSLPLPSGNWASDLDDATCLAFIAKYPRIQGLLDLAKAEAERRFDKPTFTLALNNDPESGHITHEGQSLTLHIQTNLSFYDANGEFSDDSPSWMAGEAWREWTCDAESPYGRLSSEVGAVDNLFSTYLHSQADEEG